MCYNALPDMSTVSLRNYNCVLSIQFFKNKYRIIYTISQSTSHPPVGLPSKKYSLINTELK